jgi:hypothetical protein
MISEHPNRMFLPIPPPNLFLPIAPILVSSLLENLGAATVLLV